MLIELQVAIKEIQDENRSTSISYFQVFIKVIILLGSYLRIPSSGSVSFGHGITSTDLRDDIIVSVFTGSQI